jgi:hypothetical protein
MRSQESWLEEVIAHNRTLRPWKRLAATGVLMVVMGLWFTHWW